MYLSIYLIQTAADELPESTEHRVVAVFVVQWQLRPSCWPHAAAFPQSLPAAAEHTHIHTSASQVIHTAQFHEQYVLLLTLQVKMSL